MGAMSFRFLALCLIVTPLLAHAEPLETTFARPAMWQQTFVEMRRNAAKLGAELRRESCWMISGQLTVDGKRGVQRTPGTNGGHIFVREFSRQDILPPDESRVVKVNATRRPPFLLVPHMDADSARHYAELWIRSEQLRCLVGGLLRPFDQP